jgi:hypothetical protein
VSHFSKGACPDWKKEMMIQRLFSKDVRQVFARLSNYHMKIMLREFNKKLWINIFKVTTGNLCILESSKDNGVYK